MDGGVRVRVSVVYGGVRVRVSVVEVIIVFVTAAICNCVVIIVSVGRRRHASRLCLHPF